MFEKITAFIKAALPIVGFVGAVAVAADKCFKAVKSWYDMLKARNDVHGRGGLPGGALA